MPNSNTFAVINNDQFLVGSMPNTPPRLSLSNIRRQPAQPAQEVSPVSDSTSATMASRAYRELLELTIRHNTHSKFKVGQLVSVKKTKDKKLVEGYLGILEQIYPSYSSNRFEIVVRMNEGCYKGNTVYLYDTDIIRVIVDKKPSWF